MFPEFHRHYKITGKVLPENPAREQLDSLFYEAIGAVEFLSECEGATFNHGIYRMHTTQTLRKWEAIVSEAFPRSHLINASTG